MRGRASGFIFVILFQEESFIVTDNIFFLNYDTVFVD